MKISRKVGLILAAVAIVSVLVVAYIMYSGQAAERNDLNGRLDRTQTLLPGLTSQKNALQAQLTNAQSSLDASRTQFPESVESIEYGECLFAIAADSNVGITKITASPLAGTKIGSVTYYASKFVVSISGTTENMLKFIDIVRSGKDLEVPWSADVTGVNMDVGGSATINLTIYGYKD